MRLLKKLQLFLRPAKIFHDRISELEEIDKVLQVAPGLDAVLELVLKDVNGGKESKTGRDGVTAEQIVKLGLLRKRHDMTYRELAVASGDSQSMRLFLNLPEGSGLSKSAIHGNLKAVKDTTWEKASECLVLHAKSEGFDGGEAVRGDTTTVETNIHYPTDASLLCDSVRVLCRIMDAAQTILGKEKVIFIDHRRRAKAKLFLINNTRGEGKQHPFYLELIRVTRETVTQAEAVIPILEEGYRSNDIFVAAKISKLLNQLKGFFPLAKQVVSQAYRRIVGKEKVPASEKIVSIFEEHTDIIAKGARDVVFGHKVMLTTGVSGLVFTLSVLDGNPGDSTLVSETLVDLQSLHGKAPVVVAFDGCFGSTANRDLAKAAGVEDLTFSKNGSMDLSTLLSSPKIHGALRNFRAGIEGCISFLKRVFGFARVLDRSKETFSAALHMGAFAYNLTLIARMSLAAKTTA